MSYILDALKKSDRERQDNSGPTLQTLQRPIRDSAHLHSRLILQLVIVILLLLLGLVALWIVNFSAFEAAPNSTVVAADSEAHGADNAINSVDKKRVPAPLVPKSAPTAIAAVPLIPFWQLPVAVQQEIPALTFSLHIYAENPKRRTIIINKNRMTEGDRVLPELLLESITAQGVILSWKKTYRFSIDVVEAW